MWLELGYLACSLISGFNDDAVTLKGEKSAAKQNNGPEWHSLFEGCIYFVKNVWHMNANLCKWVSTCHIAYSFKMSTLVPCDALQICTPNHIGSFKNYYIPIVKYTFCFLDAYY